MYPDKEFLFSGVRISYSGAPRIMVSIDGDFLLLDGVNNYLDMVSNTTRKVRTIYFPEGTRGYVGQLIVLNGVKGVRAEFISDRVENYTDQMLWHYSEVTFKGTVNLTGYLDSTEVIASAEHTTAKPQETKKIYYPAMSFGYIPHIRQTATDTSGELLHVRHKALPVEMYSKLRNSKKAWVTYTGAVTFQWYIDGTAQYSGAGKVLTPASSPAYRTETFWLPSSNRGNIFQWAQVGGTGDIFTVETDETLERQVDTPTMDKTRG